MTILDIYLIIPKTPNPTTQTGILSFPRIALVYPNVQGKDNKSTPHNDWLLYIVKHTELIENTRKNCVWHKRK